jgi:uncharacterized repeat protein (TIGR03847 family)
MPPLEFELKPVDRITTGAIGPPGKRVFYLQASKDEELVTLIVEKSQVQSLAVGVQQFLEELTARVPDLNQGELEAEAVEDEMSLQRPIDPAFRVGQLGLGYDDSSDLMVLVAREIQSEESEIEAAGVARFWCTRSQIQKMCRWGLEVANRGRAICGNCGQPIDPEGHFCPKRNGHKH